MLARISLILLLLTSLSSQAVSAQDLKSDLERSAPKQAKCFKGVELYYWRLDGKPAWTLLYGTNRLKTEEEIHNPKAAIRSFAQLEKLLAKLAPGEYVFFTTGGRDGAKPTAKSEESVAVKNLCVKLGLNYSGDATE